MVAKATKAPIAWVCGYPSHHFRQLHRRIEEQYPETCFFYIRSEKEGRERSYETGPLPQNMVIVTPREFSRLISQLREFNPSLVVTSGQDPRIIVGAALWAMLTRRKLCYLSDSNFAEVQKKPFLSRLIRRFVSYLYLRRMWCLLIIGTNNKSFYESCCGSAWLKQHSIRFPLPHDPAPFHSIPLPEARVDSGKIVLLFLGRLVREKGVENLIRALALLPAGIRSGFQCLIVGDGPMRPEIESLVAVEGLESAVEFLGTVPSDEAPGIFNRCDLFVLPSHYEPWGLVVNEALSSGKPVMAPEWVGAAGDLIQDGVTGFVLSDNDPVTIAKGLERVWNARDQLHAIGSSGRELVARGAWSVEGALAGWAEIVGQLETSIAGLPKRSEFFHSHAGSKEP